MLKVLDVVVVVCGVVTFGLAVWDNNFNLAIWSGIAGLGYLRLLNEQW